MEGEYIHGRPLDGQPKQRLGSWPSVGVGDLIKLPAKFGGGLAKVGGVIEPLSKIPGCPLPEPCLDRKK